MDPAEYLPELKPIPHDQKDARLKCWNCRGWMRRRPTANTPLVRMPAPHAGMCVGCHTNPLILKYCCNQRQSQQWNFFYQLVDQAAKWNFGGQVRILRYTEFSTACQRAIMGFRHPD